MDGVIRRRDLLVSSAGLFSLGLVGCTAEAGYYSLSAFCYSCSDSPEECHRDPISSVEEPIASSETFQNLLDDAVKQFDFSTCEPRAIQRRPPLLGDETWDDVASVYESLPHGYILHEGYVIYVSYSDERLPERE